MKPEKKIYFISDIHLGAPALNDNKEREKLFVAWLDEIKYDAQKLFLMGDIFDFWYEYKKVAPRGFTRTLGKLAELSDLGVEVHFFTGNHDVWVFDYLPDEIGLILHRNEFKTELMGKKFFLAHGDGLDETDKGYKLLKLLFTSKPLQWLFSRLHPNFALTLAHIWSKNSRLTKGIVGEAFKEQNEGLYLFSEKMLENEFFDYFIFGHRHLLIEMPLKGKSKFILLGEWISLFSYGVFDGENLKLKKYKNEIKS
ncbi:MAG: UDP-2,3-diacylglucosamine diphosphatase [Prolixibacteraceae bacterium]|nr:UDP-2,3-diacylglucosamine diphosphatase [Prolixibacteraceae bacterium]MBN2775805.1 UDP-2,3-diacylglucosamine diphosphatase [Prolixibacteraceae bacterium]